jgi:hypothetical protein
MSGYRWQTGNTDVLLVSRRVTGARRVQELAKASRRDRVGSPLPNSLRERRVMTGGQELLAGGYHLWRVSRGCSSPGRKKR